MCPWRWPRWTPCSINYVGNTTGAEEERRRQRRGLQWTCRIWSWLLQLWCLSSWWSCGHFCGFLHVRVTHTHTVRTFWDNVQDLRNKSGDGLLVWWLWCEILSFLIVRRESNSGVYFAGMFRVANVEFIPEYRQADSSEFVSMANQIQHVVMMM